ncbi:MAG: hypothetical protein CMO78_01905 [Verrucomicrobiales bacterium]|nr:hypothetical protein [Verrucomicrobiales bacterium]
MSEDNLATEKKLLQEAEAQGTAAKLKTYTKLSGPGWLQGAITLGGGSLAGSLYLGVIGGYQLLWLQPLMMVLGILMLSVIGYVALSTGERPFHAINKHINPVLGWGWLLAALMANLVWAMPQFSLGVAALKQNLGFGASDGFLTILLLAISAAVVWMYDSKGVKLFEMILKVMVGIIVLSFFGVVLMMAGSLEWGSIAGGFIPDFSLLSEPAAKFQASLGELQDKGAKAYWNETILHSQRDRMVAAAATAVGINMTFLLPYSLLRKGWGREHRGLARFDLGIGLFIPFFLATTCVVIASATQFHGEFNAALVDNNATEKSLKLKGGYQGNLKKRAAVHLGEEMLKEADANQTKFEDYVKSVKDTNGTKAEQAKKWKAAIDANATLGTLGPWFAAVNAKVPRAERELAAMLVKRDAFQLAGSLEQLTGNAKATQTIFGIGVVGMAISTIIILMLINGFCITEAIGAEMGGTAHKIGSLLPGVTGALGFLWLWGDSEARFWLAVPTSVFGMVLLPVAYFTFFCMMNSKSLLGDALPKGGKRVALNLAMGVALVASLIGAMWSIWSKLQWLGIGIFAGFIVLVFLGRLWLRLNQRLDAIDEKLQK